MLCFTTFTLFWHRHPKIRPTKCCGDGPFWAFKIQKDRALLLGPRRTERCGPPPQRTGRHGCSAQEYGCLRSDWVRRNRAQNRPHQERDPVRARSPKCQGRQRKSGQEGRARRGVIRPGRAGTHPATLLGPAYPISPVAHSREGGGLPLLSQRIGRKITVPPPFASAWCRVWRRIPPASSRFRQRQRCSEVKSVIEALIVGGIERALNFDDSCAKRKIPVLKRASAADPARSSIPFSKPRYVQPPQAVTSEPILCSGEPASGEWQELVYSEFFLLTQEHHDWHLELLRWRRTTETDSLVNVVVRTKKSG